MAHFLIQTHNGLILNDFCLGLYEAIRYQNFLRAGSHTFDLVETVPKHAENAIPVGTVQFVKSYLEKYTSVQNIKPVNIPSQLETEKFLKRTIWRKDSDETLELPEGEYFVKSDATVKGFAGFVKDLGDPVIPQVELLISEVLDLSSEWRAFVYDSKLVGLQNYLGEFTLMPDISLINEMVETYTDAPPAYTLDVAVTAQKETCLLEVHNFYSCGLYGFSDYRVLPYMFIRSFSHLCKNRW